MTAFNRSGSSRGSENPLETEHILEVVIIEFPIRLNVEQEKDRNLDDSKVLI